LANTNDAGRDEIDETQSRFAGKKRCTMFMHAFDLLPFTFNVLNIFGPPVGGLHFLPFFRKGKKYPDHPVNPV
jgi:hypothetical protein